MYLSSGNSGGFPHPCFDRYSTSRSWGWASKDWASQLRIRDFVHVAKDPNLSPRPCNCTHFEQSCRNVLSDRWHYTPLPNLPRNWSHLQNLHSIVGIHRRPDLWVPADLPIAPFGTHPRFFFCSEHKLGACKCFEATYRKSELIWSLGGVCTRSQQNGPNWFTVLRITPWLLLRLSIWDRIREFWEQGYFIQCSESKKLMFGFENIAFLFDSVNRWEH